MKLLSLDISSHTGWAILDNDKLLEYGKLDIPCDNDEWPIGILQWAKETAMGVFNLIENHPSDIIVIERANSSRFRGSQNFLDWTHAFLIEKLLDERYMPKVRYIDSIHWRKVCGLKLNTEQKKQNKLARQASKKGEILKINGKRAGVVSKKHLAVLKTNEVFGTNFKPKDHDICEAIMLGYSYIIENS